jgi:uncharacterized OB-fold protein
MEPNKFNRTPHKFIKNFFCSNKNKRDNIKWIELSEKFKFNMVLHKFIIFFVKEKNLYGAKMGVGKVFFPLTKFCMRKKSANTKKNIHQESHIWYF